MTTEDLAVVVRDALLQHTEGYFDQQRDALVALATLTARAEMAEQAHDALQQIADIPEPPAPSLRMRRIARDFLSGKR